MDIRSLLNIEIINRQIAQNILQGIVIFCVGYLCLRIISFLIGKVTLKRLSPQTAMVIQKAFFYSFLLLLTFISLNIFGIRLSALLGAAGIIGIALGFASQTSVSNIISGTFLIGEKSFEVGDLIKVGDYKGIVLSIDLLSIKLRTFNNEFIRIPNENLIKTEVINITRFPIRRLDNILGVAYKEDIKRVLAILKDIADKNPLVLDEPEPFIIFDGFGDSSLDIKFGVWVNTEEYFKLKKQILVEIKERFDADGIEIPFPHRTIYTGSMTDPLPIYLVDKKKSLNTNAKAG